MNEMIEILCGTSPNQVNILPASQSQVQPSCYPHPTAMSQMSQSTPARILSRGVEPLEIIKTKDFQRVLII